MVGKRLVDAIPLQPDLTLAGIVVRSQASAPMARLRLKVPTYSADDSAGPLLEEIIAECDVILDCTTEGVGDRNSLLYRKAGVRYILQGGESPSSVDLAAYSTSANFEQAVGRKSARIVSCNTTAQARVVASLAEVGRVDRAEFTIIKRIADPSRKAQHEANALHPALGKPTHHVADLSCLFPLTRFWASAVRAQTTLMHLNIARFEMGTTTSLRSVEEALFSSDRIALIEGTKTGLDSTAQLAELGRDLARARGDLPEALVWRDSIRVEGDVLRLAFAVHMESIVIPETLDCVRALSGLCNTREAAIGATDAGLRSFYGPPLRALLSSTG